MEISLMDHQNWWGVSHATASFYTNSQTIITYPVVVSCQATISCQAIVSCQATISYQETVSYPIVVG